MVVGTLSLVQKGQTSGRSGCSMQNAVHSGIVVYGGGDIVFGAERSNQWMQYPVDAVCSAQWNSGILWWAHCLWCKKVKPEDTVDAVHSGIVVYGGGDIVLWCKKVKPMDAVCSGHSGIVIYDGGDIVFGAKSSNQRMQWMQYTLDPVCSAIVVCGGGDIVFGTKRSSQ